jgi:hypothetical protein
MAAAAIRSRVYVAIVPVTAWFVLLDKLARTVIVSAAAVAALVAALVLVAAAVTKRRLPAVPAWVVPQVLLRIRASGAFRPAVVVVPAMLARMTEQTASRGRSPHSRWASGVGVLRVAAPRRCRDEIAS